MNQLANTRTVHHGLSPAVLGTGQFMLHFLEMCLAMMAGMALFAPVKLALVSRGYASLLDVTSLDYQIWMNLFMAVPMVVWMRVRGCSWRAGVEMGIAMLAPVALVLVLCTFAHDPLPWLTVRSAGPAMLIGMLAIMAYRHEHYTHGYSLRRWQM